MKLRDESLLKRTFKLSPEGVLLRFFRNKNWKPATLSETTGGYLRVGYPTRQQITVHRLVWFLHYGSFPKGEIDHIDNDRKNNQITNLREVSKSQNQANRLPNKNSLSKYKGVYLGARGKWIASLTYKKVRYYLGQFNCETAAALAYNEKAKQLKDFFRKVN